MMHLKWFDRTSEECFKKKQNWTCSLMLFQFIPSTLMIDFVNKMRTAPVRECMINDKLHVTELKWMRSKCWRYPVIIMVIIIEDYPFICIHVHNIINLRSIDWNVFLSQLSINNNLRYYLGIWFSGQRFHNIMTVCNLK